MKSPMHDVRSAFVHLVFFIVASFGFDVDPELCRSALGMESRQIPDSAIMASSAYEEVILGPLNSRIRTERYGGAWCPKPMISREVYEWLQIDFTDLVVITAVETQGRYGNGQGQEYAPSYMIEYQKRDGDRLWRRYRNVKGQELFRGNNDTQNTEMRSLDPFVVARRIRFVPFSHHPRTICMRVEMYGCTWRDGLVSYDMRQGDTKGDDLDFSDFLYDGFQINGHLSDGLGQLTDKRTGHSNFRLDVNNTGRRGFEWIGWRRRGGSHPDQVEIRFRFDTVRNFSRVRIHANNMFSRDVRVFRSAVVHFSVGGRHFDRLQRPVESIQTRDDDDEEGRYVTITIDNYLARFVILVLRFDARWILISEIDFVSELAVGNFTEEVEPREANMASTVGVQSASPRTETPQSNSHGQFLESGAEVEKNEEEEKAEDSIWYRSNISTSTVATAAAAAADHAMHRSYLAALIGTTIAVAIVTAVACVCLGVWYRRRRLSFDDRKYSSSPSSSSSSLGKKKSVFVVDRCHRRDPSDGGGGGDGDHLYTPPDRHGLLDAGGGGGGGGGKSGKTARPSPSRQVDERSVVQEMINEQLMHDLMTSSSNEFHRRSLPPIPSGGGGGGGGRAIHPLGGGGEGGDTVPLCAEGFVTSVGDLPGETLVRVPSDRLRTIEMFGEGAYTEIRACELKGMACHMTSPDRRSCVSDVKDESMLVIVKSLKHDASIKNRQDFEDEIKRSSKLNHKNVVRFFGQSGSGGHIEMVLEYSVYGTLHQFLQQRTTVINTSDISIKYQPPFSHGYLIYMATEIACGMKYLESCDLVHRDLATRNCLVSNELTIKVTDMASACHRYSNHYYHIPGGRTSDPVRWMAWESILLRNFTSRSDIWAFGVTLWEILTCARTLPFDHLSNEQVFDNASHYYQSDGEHQRLPQPTGCTREVYDLMVECWQREAGQRPTFKEIHLFLSRKNLGFNPLEESCISGQGTDNDNLLRAD